VGLFCNCNIAIYSPINLLTQQFIIHNKEDIEMQAYSWLIPIMLVLIGSGIFLILSRKNGYMKHADPEDKKSEKIELIERFFMSKHLGGFTGTDKTAPLVFCAVSEDYFLFTMGTHGRELGRIPRDSINQIIIDDKAHIVKHLTGDNSVELENLIHPVTIGDKSYCLVIDWDDADGERRNTVFIFQDKQCEASAQKAQEKLEQWIKARELDMFCRHAYNQ